MLSPSLFANDATPQANTNTSLPLDKKDSAAPQQQNIGNGTKRDVAKLSIFVLGIVLLIGVFFVIFVVLPYFIGWHDKCGSNCEPVNKATCDCKCFDGLNKVRLYLYDVDLYSFRDLMVVVATNPSISTAKRTHLLF